MRQLIIMLFVFITVLFTASCGFRLHGTKLWCREMKTLIFQSNDPYSQLTRNVRHQLHLNDVNIIEENKMAITKYPILILDKENQKRNTISMFINGATAEYSLIINARAQVFLSSKIIYPISTTVYGSFFNNPNTPLAKDVEQDMILKEMRQRAAEQLVRKLLTVQPIQESKKYTQPKSKTLAPGINSRDFTSLLSANMK